MNPQPIRVLALMEAPFLTGPAKNLIEFARRTRMPSDATPVEIALATYQRGDTASAFVTAARTSGIPIHVLPERRRFDLAPLGLLRSVVDEFRPDIIQSHNVKSHLFVRMLGLHGRYPWVAFHHGYTATDLKDRMYNQVDRWSLRKASRLVCVCAAFAGRLQRRGVPADRIRIRHNSVNPFLPPAPQAVSEIRRELGLEDSRVILSVGRLSAEKGHADLLEAVALLARRGGMAGCKLVIVGDGPERSPLERLADRLEIAGVVKLAGHRGDVKPFYAMAELLALPSHSEGSPNVVLEAMAAGVPVAATAAGGVAEIVEHEQTGLLTNVGDPAGMADAIQRLLAGEELRMALSEKALRLVRDRFTPEAYYRTVVGIYEEVLAPRRQ